MEQTAILVGFALAVLSPAVIARVVLGLGRRRWFLAQLAAHEPRRSRALCRLVGARMGGGPERASLGMLESYATMWDGSFARALSLCRRHSASAAKNAVPRALVEIEVALLDERYADARALLQREEAALAAVPGTTYDLAWIRGALALDAGRFADARRDLLAAREGAAMRDAIRPAASFLLAATAHRLGDAEEVERYLGEAIREGGDLVVARWARHRWSELLPTRPMPSRSPAAKPARRGPIAAFARDVYGGLGTLLRAGGGRRACDHTAGRAMALLVFDVLLFLALRALVAPGAHLDVVGIITLVGPLLVFSVIGVALAAGSRDRTAVARVIGAFYGVLPGWLLVWAPISNAVGADSPFVALPALLAAFALVLLLGTTVVRLADRVGVASTWPRRAAVVVAFVGLWVMPLVYTSRTAVREPVLLSTQPHLRAPPMAPVTGVTREDHRRENEAAFAQAERLSRALDGLAPERGGRADLWFLGAATWSDQDVFLNEMRSTRAVLDERFDTRGHSLLLANDPRSAEELPVASTSSLRRALRALGAKMNRDEDVLFLYLTSHGSEAGLAVRFGDHVAFDDERITPSDIVTMLDDARIRWRVLVVSGCQSGVFVEPLRSPDSLVVTAASESHPSYGCAVGRAATDFGALVVDELRRKRSIDAALDAAVRRATEADSTRDVPARPRIARGDAIAKKLEGIVIPPRSGEGG